MPFSSVNGFQTCQSFRTDTLIAKVDPPHWYQWSHRGTADTPCHQICQCLASGPNAADKTSGYAKRPCNFCWDLNWRSGPGPRPRSLCRPQYTALCCTGRLDIWAMSRSLRHGKCIFVLILKNSHICTHLKQGEMSVEPAPKIFIQNKLAKCRSKLQELDPLIVAKRMSWAML